LQIFNDEKKRIGLVFGFKNRAITTTLDSGDKELSFEYPANGKIADLLKEEYYIRTKTDEFVLKAVEKGEKFNKYTAVLNVEELEGMPFPYGFESQEQTIRACLEFAFEGTGWTVRTCAVTKKRTINEEGSVTAWDVLQKCLSTYRCECVIDSLNKAIDIYEQVGSDKGCYFIEGLNLRKLTPKSDTYEFYTRIYPIGKDGITPEWLLGHDYIDNFQYSNKIKAFTWKDERYTNTTSLIEDATAKLEEASRPYKAFTAEIADLAKASEKHREILSFGIGDVVTLVSKTMRTKEKQRIVKIVEYPETPKKNTAEISNARKTFAQIQQEETKSAQEEAISISNRTTKKVLENYSTTEEMETKITASKEEVELGVMHTLESYYDKTETDALINISKGEIELEVSQIYQTKAAMSDYSTTKETKSFIDLAIDGVEIGISEKLEKYPTTTEMNAAIKVKTDAITTEVNKKVNNSEFGTKISQNAYYVRVAWNNNSNYIQFENGGISVYDGSVEQSKKRAVFNYSGEHFYRDGYYIGKIGTNQWSGNNAHKGLVFDLEYNGKYMTFAQEKTEGATTYTTMLTFSRENSIYDTYGIHLGCDIDMHWNKIKNVSWEGGGITQTINYVQVLEMNSDGTVARWGKNGRMEFTNGILTDLTYYTQ
jgi:phage minor structural protein